MVYLPWLVILLIPYWLGPVIVWLTQKAGARPVFERFTPGRHLVPEDVAAYFRQTCDGLTTEGFSVALAVAMFTAARPARLVASYAELPTKFRDGRTVSVHNSPLLGSLTPPPSRVRERKRSRRWPASSWVRNDSTVVGTRWTGSRSSANVVLHEFAHQLDAEDGFSDGAPILPPNALGTWGGVLSEEYERLRGDAEHDRQSPLDEYGATNTAEFFAVATESFFEKPVQLEREHPALYGQLREFYRQDPARRTPSIDP